MRNIFVVSLMCLSLVTLNGCIWLAAGAAGAGGYYVGKDDRPAGQMTRDAATTSKVKTALIRDYLVKARNINVDTFNDEVTLKGHVETEEQKSRASELAWSVKNVKAVVNHLAVIP